MPQTNVFVDGRNLAWLFVATLVTVAVTSTLSSLPTFVVYNGENPCILMTAVVQLNNPFNNTYTPTVDNVSSDCSDIVLDITNNRSISFAFEANTTSWWLAETTFTNEGKNESNKTRLFTIKLGQSYQCDSTQTIVLGNTLLTVTGWKVQAFNFSSQGTFDASMHCSLDQSHTTLNTVPIAVGAALGGLVIVTLVAYLVGRFKRRSVLLVTTGGYEPIPS